MNDQQLLETARTAGCTDRQLEVLTLKAAGYGNTRIGKILGISHQAVAYRLDGAYRKLREVRNGQ